MANISPRFAWTAAILPIEPDHCVLEVGPRLVADTGSRSCRSRRGSRPARSPGSTGADRPAKMIAAATKRNAALVNAGKVRLRSGSLHELDDAPGSFDLIFAKNLASFRTHPARDLAARRLLKPGRTLCLSVQQPPTMSSHP